MCQTWQWATHILAHAIKWSWAVSHAQGIQAGEDTNFWEQKWSNCTAAPAHPQLHTLPCTTTDWALCRVWLLEMGIVRGWSYSVHIMVIQRQQGKNKYPVEMQFYPLSSCLNSLKLMALSCLQGLCRYKALEAWTDSSKLRKSVCYYKVLSLYCYVLFVGISYLMLIYILTIENSVT